MPRPTKWVTLDCKRIPTADPDEAMRDFARDFWPGRPPKWADREAGIFTIPGALSIYRARPVGGDNVWVFEFACRS